MSYSVPLSYRAVERYQDYLVALETMQLRMTYRDKEPLEENPFCVEEHPRRHLIYKAILSKGAVTLYNTYCLDEKTIEQFVVDDTTSLQFPHDFDEGSNEHLDYLIKMQESGKNITDINFDQMHFNRDCLEFVAPVIAECALQDKGREFEVQLTAIEIDQDLGNPISHLLPKDNPLQVTLTVGQNNTEEFVKKFHYALKR
jgi:hypothetical protein